MILIHSIKLIILFFKNYFILHSNESSVSDRVPSLHKDNESEISNKSEDPTAPQKSIDNNNEIERED